MKRTDERAVDEYLGFAHKADPKDERPAPVSVPEHDDGAYEDSWYQVLKARTDKTEES